MLADETFRKLALALPDVKEKSLFGRPKFRVRDKIFAGFTKAGTAHIKLTPEQQSFVCDSERGVASPIPGGWGNQGWTEIDQSRADTDLLHSLLLMSWKNVAPKALLRTFNSHRKEN